MGDVGCWVHLRGVLGGFLLSLVWCVVMMGGIGFGREQQPHSPFSFFLFPVAKTPESAIPQKKGVRKNPNGSNPPQKEGQSERKKHS